MLLHRLFEWLAGTTARGCALRTTDAACAGTGATVAFAGVGVGAGVWSVEGACAWAVEGTSGGTAMEAGVSGARSGGCTGAELGALTACCTGAVGVVLACCESEGGGTLYVVNVSDCNKASRDKGALVTTGTGAGCCGGDGAGDGDGGGVGFGAGAPGIRLAAFGMSSRPIVIPVVESTTGSAPPLSQSSTCWTVGSCPKRSL